MQPKAIHFDIDSLKYKPNFNDELITSPLNLTDEFTAIADLVADKF